MSTCVLSIIVNTVETRQALQMYTTFFFQGLKGDPGPEGRPGMKGDKVSHLKSRIAWSLQTFMLTH